MIHVHCQETQKPHPTPPQVTPQLDKRSRAGAADPEGAGADAGALPDAAHADCGIAVSAAADTKVAHPSAGLLAAVAATTGTMGVDIWSLDRNLILIFGLLITSLVPTRYSS